MIDIVKYLEKVQCDEHGEREHSKRYPKTAKGGQEVGAIEHSLSPTDLFGEVE